MVGKPQELLGRGEVGLQPWVMAMVLVMPFLGEGKMGRWDPVGAGDGLGWRSQRALLHPLYLSEQLRLEGKYGGKAVGQSWPGC